MIEDNMDPRVLIGLARDQPDYAATLQTFAALPPDQILEEFRAWFPEPVWNPIFRPIPEPRIRAWLLRLREACQEHLNATKVQTSAQTCKCPRPGADALLCALDAQRFLYPDTEPCGCRCHAEMNS
jgi:hypothetical protein